MLTVAAWMHHVGWPWLVAAGDIPWALIHLSPPWWWFAVAGLGVIIALLPLPLAFRVGAIVWLTGVAFDVAGTAMTMCVRSGRRNGSVSSHR